MHRGSSFEFSQGSTHSEEHTYNVHVYQSALHVRTYDIQQFGFNNSAKQKIICTVLIIRNTKCLNIKQEKLKIQTSNS